MCNSCLQPSIITKYLYDAVYLYMKIIDQIVSMGGDYRNGIEVAQNSLGMQFAGEN